LEDDEVNKVTCSSVEAEEVVDLVIATAGVVG
jgi:hypothetical protein